MVLFHMFMVKSMHQLVEMSMIVKNGCHKNNSKEAITNFTVLERYDDMSLIECRLETGRTHQIRVHMSYIGYPVYGDPKYGKKKDDQSHGQFLHAKN